MEKTLAALRRAALARAAGTLSDDARRTRGHLAVVRPVCFCAEVYAMG
jgi:hypothetical protein